jgi:nucleotide-binding universal stress UspA family protein
MEVAMPIKTIAVVLTDPETAKMVIESAICVAEGHEAHLIGLHGEAIDPPPVLSPFDLPDASVIATLYSAAAERSKGIEALFNEMTGRSGVSAGWRTVRGTSGLASQAVVESCRAADLVIASQPAAGRVGELDDVLFESGRPVLFIPWIARACKPFARILIAWDGSRESTRAIFDSTSLLRAAAEVEIFSIDAADTRSQSAVLTGADIAESLARRGLTVTVNSQESARLPVASVIENRCSDFAADLLVMGAYSHARIRERLFGGVTQTLLESMTVPVLMSR